MLKCRKNGRSTESKLERNSFCKKVHVVVVSLCCGEKINFTVILVFVKVVSGHSDKIPYVLYDLTARVRVIGKRQNFVQIHELANVLEQPQCELRSSI